MFTYRLLKLIGYKPDRREHLVRYYGWYNDMGQGTFSGCYGPAAVKGKAEKLEVFEILY